MLTSATSTRVLRLFVRETTTSSFLMMDNYHRALLVSNIDKSAKKAAAWLLKVNSVFRGHLKLN